MVTTQRDPAGLDRRAAPVQPVFTTTSAWVAAALGYTRRYRRLLFVQQCLYKHTRRNLLLLLSSAAEVWVRGVLPRFRAYWRVLTQPSQEAFLHPITSDVVFDVGLSRRQLKGSSDPRRLWDVVYSAMSLPIELPDRQVDQAWAAFKVEQMALLRVAVAGGVGWQRFLLA